MLEVGSNSDLEAKRICQNLMKEMPRMDNVSVRQASIYSVDQKKVIEEKI